MFAVKSLRYRLSSSITLRHKCFQLSLESGTLVEGMTKCRYSIITNQIRLGSASCNFSVFIFKTWWWRSGNDAPSSLTHSNPRPYQTVLKVKFETVRPEQNCSSYLGTGPSVTYLPYLLYLKIPRLDILFPRSVNFPLHTSRPAVSRKGGSTFQVMRRRQPTYSQAKCNADNWPETVQGFVQPKQNQLNSIRKYDFIYKFISE